MAGALIDFYSPETLLLEDILAAPRDLVISQRWLNETDATRPLDRPPAPRGQLETALNGIGVSTNALALISVIPSSNIFLSSWLEGGVGVGWVAEVVRLRRPDVAKSTYIWMFCR